MTNDRPIRGLNYQGQASIHFNLTMVGQYDVILYRHYKKASPKSYSLVIEILSGKGNLYKKQLSVLNSSLKNNISPYKPNISY